MIPDQPRGAIEYPNRQKFFALKFIRLLAKCCAAQEIGPDGCWLITIIVGLEDAKRYSAPVTYYNEQLLPLLGCCGVKPLNKARGKAVKCGWLHYDEGSKSIPGKYWVTVPDRFAEIDDSTFDNTKLPVPNGTTKDNCQDVCQSQTGQATGTTRERQWTGNGFTYKPIPKPDPDPTAPASVAGTGKMPTAKKKTPSKARTYSHDFDRFWAVYWNRRNKSAAANAFPDALARIVDDTSLPPTTEDDAVTWLVDRTRAYSVQRDETSDNLHAATFLNADRFVDELTPHAVSSTTKTREERELRALERYRFLIKPRANDWSIDELRAEYAKSKKANP